jgi:hypothetical protein
VPDGPHICAPNNLATIKKNCHRYDPKTIQSIYTSVTMYFHNVKHLKLSVHLKRKKRVFSKKLKNKKVSNLTKFT